MNQGTQFWGTKSWPLAAPWSWFRWAGGRAKKITKLQMPKPQSYNYKKHRIWGKVWKSVGLHLADSVGEGMTWYESPSRPIGRRSLEVPVPSGCKFHQASWTNVFMFAGAACFDPHPLRCEVDVKYQTQDWGPEQEKQLELPNLEPTSIGDMKYSINI